jgi:hypothetical protein
VSNVSPHFSRRAGLFSRLGGPVGPSFRVREPTPYEPSHRARGRPSRPYGRREPHVRPLCAYHPPTPPFGRRLLIWRSALHACCRELPTVGSARRAVRRGANRSYEHPSRPRSRPPPCTDRPHRTFAADCSCAACLALDSAALSAAQGWRRATVLRSSCRLLFASPPGTNLVGIDSRSMVRARPLPPSLHLPV